MDLIQFLQLTSAVGALILVYVLYLQWRDSRHKTTVDR